MSSPFALVSPSSEARTDGWPLLVGLPRDPSLAILAVFALVATGNAFWGDQPEWKTLRSIALFAVSISTLVTRARIGRELEGLRRTNKIAEDVPLPGATVFGIPLTVLGVILFLIVVAGELVSGESGAVSHFRLMLLAPACLLLLYDCQRARHQLLLARPAQGADPVTRQGLFALEALLFRGTWIAVWAVAILAVGNALWGQTPAWGTLRPGLYGVLLLALVWELRKGVGSALLKLSDGVVDEQHRLEHFLSREWAVEEDPTRDRSWSTAAILEALDLKPGMHVADVGAGGGYFASKMAERVGPGGAVVATDIAPMFVARLRQLSERLGMPQLRVQLVEETHPLPMRAAFDRVLLSNVYAFRLDDEQRAKELLDHLINSLRPGGKLVIYNEFVHERGWAAGPEWPPLAASDADADWLIRSSADRCTVAQKTEVPVLVQPLAPHEKPGYLLVLERR